MEHAPEPPLARLPESLHAPVQQVAERAKLLGEEQVLGLAIYGAAVAGMFQPEYHVVRSALVLSAINLDLLKRLAVEAPPARRWRFAPPMILTRQTIDGSRDTFPLELIEIQQWHVRVFGDDYFANLAFDAADVRLQCEHDLKAISIAMHQGLLASGGHEERLGSLSADLTESLLRVLRGMLWLAGQRQPQPTFHAIEAVEKLIGRPLAGVCAALDRSDMAGWHKFRRLYDDIQALGLFADAM